MIDPRSDSQFATSPAQEVLRYVYSFYLPAGRGSSPRERSLSFLRLHGVETPVLDHRLVRITGTNGKSSTAALVEEALLRAGETTVSLTSPHAFSVRERIRINGELVTWSQLSRTLREMAPTLERLRGTRVQPNPTEIWTWASFLLYRRVGAKYGIMEGSKGGRSDVVNFFSGGVVGLTNIGDDHIEEFGGSRSSLLVEKLGFTSKGDTLCYGLLGESEERIVREYCRSHQVQVRKIGRLGEGLEADAGLDRAHIRNVDLAREVLVALGHCRATQHLTYAITPPKLHGRLEARTIAGRRFLLDGAHNTGSISRLVDVLNLRPRVRIMIFAAHGAKDWRVMLRECGQLVGLALIICVEATNGPFVGSRTLASVAQRFGLKAVAVDGIYAALQLAFAASRWRECVVTGSFKLLYDFACALRTSSLTSGDILEWEVDPRQPWMKPLC